MTIASLPTTAASPGMGRLGPFASWRCSMRLRRMMIAAVAAAAAGALIVPALAQAPNGAGSAPPQGPGMSMGRTGHGMMGRGMMRGGMMSGSCAGMMGSMAGGDGRPNSQWQTHRPEDGAPD